MSATIDRPYPTSGTISPQDHLVADDRRTALLNRTSWGAILAGLVTALVVQLLLNILGVAIGLASVTVDTSANNPDAANASMVAGIWWLVSGLLASLAGGVVAGRLCGSSRGSTAGWHGFVSWAATTLVIFYMITTALGGIVGGTFNALSSTLGSAGRSVASAVSDATQAGASGGAGSGLEAQVRGLLNNSDAQNAQQNVTDYITASVQGDQPAADAAKQRAIDSLAKSANISPEEARAKIDQKVADLRAAADRAKAKATAAAEQARKAASTGGLFGTAALVLGAVCAALGGRIGKPHLAIDDIDGRRLNA